MLLTEIIAACYILIHKTVIKATIFKTVLRIQLLDSNTVHLDIYTVTPDILPGYLLVL